MAEIHEPEEMTEPAPRLMPVNTGARTTKIKVLSNEPPLDKKQPVVRAKAEEETPEPVEPEELPAAGEEEQPQGEESEQFEAEAEEGAEGEEQEQPEGEEQEEIEGGKQKSTPQLDQARRDLERAANWGREVNNRMMQDKEFRKAYVEHLKRVGAQIDPGLLKSIEDDPAAAPAPAAAAQKPMSREEAAKKAINMMADRDIIGAIEFLMDWKMGPQIQGLEQKTAAEIKTREQAAAKEVQAREHAFVVESFRALAKNPAYGAYIKIKPNNQFELNPQFDQAIMKYVQENNIKITPELNFEKLCAHALLDMDVLVKKPGKPPALAPDRPRSAPNRGNTPVAQRNGRSQVSNGKMIVRIPLKTRQF